MKRYPTVLAIAGSDCSGGAGIQADIKTISALGCYATSVITAVTVQNTCGVARVYPIPADIVGAQIHAILEDIEVDAIKIGMVMNAEIIKVIAEELSACKVPIIFDPVLVSSSGTLLAEPSTLEVMCKQLIPICTLITPNIPEAEALSGIRIDKEEEREKAGFSLLKSGCQSVLIKGGHLPGHDMEDILVTGTSQKDIFRFHAERVTSKNTHGTGCTFSSAIASYMAKGYDLYHSVEKGKEYLTQALIAGKEVTIGQGYGPLNHFFNPMKLIIR